VELFGESSLQADIEVIELFLKSLDMAGIDSVHLDLGHVDIFRGLLANADLNADQEAELFELLQRKAVAEINIWVSDNISDPKLSDWLKLLPKLSGNSDVLQIAKEGLAGAPDPVIEALNQLQQIVLTLADSDITIYLDLGELPGFHYHTGVVFAAYVQGYGKALGNGGRYDHVGEAFGRSRPATGFAFDLKSLVTKGQFKAQLKGGIYVPANSDPECQKQVVLLRQQGERVVQGFAGQIVDPQEINCDRQLVQKGDQFVIKKLS
jgi:ATP phosphoribosyltransferase regulatory subunit